MGKIPNELREIIAHNIRTYRIKKFPLHGGSKLCAEAFGVSQQQWSPWENGRRTPDELRLEKIAEFFGVTVDDLRKDNRPKAKETTPPHTQNPNGRPPEYTSGQIPGIDIPPPPGWQPDPPGSPASFFWLLRHLLMRTQSQGIRIDKECLDYLAAKLRPPEG